MLQSWHRAVEKAKVSSAGGPLTPSQERLMFDDIDPDLDVQYREVKAYEEGVLKLQRQLDGCITSFKETSQAMCSISESLAVSLKVNETGVSMDACNYLNAMTAISNESIAEFEQSIRQEVMADIDGVLNESCKIEEMMRHRMDLLRQHDALHRDTMRKALVVDGKDPVLREQQERLLVARGGFFTVQNKLKLEMSLVLRDRIKVYERILARFRASQLSLFARMHASLRKSTHHTALSGEFLQSATDKHRATAEEQLERAVTTSTMETAAPLSDAVVDRFEEKAAVVVEAVDQVTDVILDDALLVAVAVAVCEQEVQRQLEAEVERSTPRRRVGSTWATDKVSGNAQSTSSSSTPRRLNSDDRELTHTSREGPIDTSLSAPSTPPALAGATPWGSLPSSAKTPSVNTVEKPPSGTGAFSEMQSMFKRWGSQSTLSRAFSDPGKRSSKREENKAIVEEDEVVNSEEGWMRLEEEFQQGLLRAAKNAEKRRGFGPLIGGAGPVADERGYLAAINLSKAFNLPFTLVSKSIDQPAFVKGLDWSLSKDAFKYSETLRLEEQALLKYFFSQPPKLKKQGSSLGLSGVGARREQQTKQQSDHEMDVLRTRQLLGAALRFLDITDLARCCQVCRTWNNLLVLDEKVCVVWKQSVRRTGVPDRWRGRLWRHLMYNGVPWLSRPKRQTARRGSKQPSKRFPAVRYETLVARAIEHIQHFERTGRMLSDGASVFGAMDGEEGEEGNAIPPSEQADEFGPRRSNWISEIDVDVKRTYVIDRGYDLWKNVSGTGSLQQPNSSRFVRDTMSEIASEDDAEEGECDSPVLSSTSSFADVDRSVSRDGSLMGAEPWEDSRRYAESEQDIAEEGDDDMTGLQAGLKPVLQDQMSQEDRISREIQRQRLSRVLWAFAMYNPRVRYCQGMNMVAALLLKVTDNDEDAAFWLLAGMCEQYMLDEMWADGMPRLKLCFHVLDRLIAMRCPALHQHFQDCGVHVAMFSSKWFVTLFANLDTLPLKTVLRIWDVFFVEGWPVIFGVAVSLIEMLESQLRDLDLEDVLRVMQDPRQALRDAFTTQKVSYLQQRGGGGPSSTKADSKMSVILMRRTSALVMGDRVLKDVETTYKV